MHGSLFMFKWFVINEIQLSLSKSSKYKGLVFITDLTAEILAKSSEALLVEAKKREDLEKPFHLCQVDCCYSFIKLLCNNDL